MKNNIRLIILYSLVSVFINAHAQTHPTPMQVPMSQDFGSNWFTTLPTGVALWRVSGSPSTSQVAAANSTPTADDATFDSATVVKSPGKAYGYSGIGSGNVNVNNGQFYIQTSSATTGTDQLAMAVKTTGFTSIKISFEIEMINPQPKKCGIVCQYRVGTSGSWTVIDSSYFHNSGDRIQNQVDYFVNLPLGSNADNQPVVELRWATSRDPNPSGGGSCGLAIDNVVVSGDPVTTPQYFRSVASGNWNSTSTWESSFDQITWAPATAPPSSGDKKVIIQSPDIVNTTGINNLVIDELVINSGAIFWNSWGTALAVEDGPSAIDLQVDGTFEDSSNVSVVWVNTARWSMGNYGTYVKTYNTNSTLWQLKYYNGIANIPSTSNWYCRKAAASSVEPAISTTNGGPPYPQATYGNLYIENYASSWNSNNLCKFSGSNNVPLIKGNFYIGGNGTGNVSFLYSNTYASLLQVQGNVIVKNGSTFRNEGTGLDVQGDLTCNGTLSYGASSSKLLFSGSYSQTIQGNGTITAYKLEINKPAADATMTLKISVYYNLNLLSGKFITASSSPMVIQDNATATNGSNTSFISGPMQKTGDDAFTFPIGKSSLMRPAGMSAGTGTSTSDIFTAEYFPVNPQGIYGSAIDPSLDHISSCEYWTIARNSGSAQKTVTLSWDANSCGVSNLSELRVAHFNSTLWYNEGNTATTGNFSKGTVTSSAVSGWGPFTLASTTTNNPLPVQLLSFSADVVENNVVTSWTTASEINNNYFTVEKSHDGIHFLSVGIKYGAGNSSQLLNYEMTDESPFPGISYYRLKQTDYDGVFTYSDIVPVKIKSKTFQIISIEPQREVNSINILASFAQESPARIVLRDITGKLVADYSFASEAKIMALHLDVAGAEGIYYLQIFSGQDVMSAKFYF